MSFLAVIEINGNFPDGSPIVNPMDHWSNQINSLIEDALPEMLRLDAIQFGDSSMIALQLHPISSIGPKSIELLLDNAYTGTFPLEDGASVRMSLDSVEWL